MIVTVCTYAVPDSQRNRLVFFQTRGTQDIDGALPVQGTAHLRYVNLKISNGAASGLRAG